MDNEQKRRRSPADQELHAIKKVMAILVEIGPKSAVRVLDYIASRWRQSEHDFFKLPEGSKEEKTMPLDFGNGSKEVTCSSEIGSGAGCGGAV